jgi:hypothetical protein
VALILVFKGKMLIHARIFNVPFRGADVWYFAWEEKRKIFLHFGEKNDNE